MYLCNVNILIMTIDKIKQIIIANQQLVKKIKLIERKFKFDNNLNYVLVGVRQCGKSFLMYQRMKELVKKGHSFEDFIYLNFDDERMIEFTVADFDLILQAYASLYNNTPILFLDEIQNIEHWENFARRLANEKYRVYITGSNAKMLSSEVATVLGGRYIIQNVYPYSFSEFLNAKGVKLNKNWHSDNKTLTVIRKNFDDYFNNGGFPECTDIGVKRLWLNVLYQKILLGDLIARYKIRNTQSLQLLIKKLAESIKQPSSYTRLTKIICASNSKIQLASVIDYLKYAEETRLIFSIQNHASKFAEKETQRKYYFTDNGILNLFLLDGETSLLENIVAIALREKYETLYYYNSNVEIDFYVPERRTAYQVSYSIEAQNTWDREVNALIKFAKVEKIEKMYIITYDEENIIQKDNVSIYVIPCWKWMLTENL